MCSGWKNSGMHPGAFCVQIELAKKPRSIPQGNEQQLTACSHCLFPSLNSPELGSRQIQATAPQSWCQWGAGLRRLLLALLLALHLCRFATLQAPTGHTVLQELDDMAYQAQPDITWLCSSTVGNTAWPTPGTWWHDQREGAGAPGRTWYQVLPQYNG